MLIINSDFITLKLFDRYYCINGQFSIPILLLLYILLK